MSRVTSFEWRSVVWQGRDFRPQSRAAGHWFPRIEAARPPNGRAWRYKSNNTNNL